MEDSWISIEEAAQISGYHPEHIRRLIRGGKVKGRKFSIVWQVDRASFYAYLEEQKRAKHLPANL
jgi:hypothetical protein